MEILLGVQINDLRILCDRRAAFGWLMVEGGSVIVIERV